MHLSRPLSVLIFMGLMVAAAAWYSPPQHQTGHVAVLLPDDIYTLLLQKGEAQVDASGHPHSVAQVIEGYARQ